MSFLERSSRERIALLIDASNMAHAIKRTGGGKFDYAALLKYYNKVGYVVTARYFTAVTTEENGHQPLRNLLTALSSNGYRVEEKPASTFVVRGGPDITKGNVDVEIACAGMNLADKVHKIVLFSGDNDFSELVRCIQDKGCRVEVVSVHDMCGLKLRRQADSFVDLSSLVEALNKLA
jgi:uncharacterized LabA/DUF88 family protein